MPNTTETLKRLNLQRQSLPKRNFSNGVQTQIDALLADAEGEAQRVQTNTRNIRSSPRLTVNGQDQSLAELAGDLKKVLTPRWEAAIQKFSDLEARLTRVLSTGVQAPQGDAVVVEMRSREIRESLKGKSQAELGLLFMSAVQEGNDALVWALRSAPMPMLSPEIIAKAEERQSQQRNPREYQLRTEAREALSVLSLNWESLQSWLNEIGAKKSSADRIREIVEQRQAVA